MSKLNDLKEKAKNYLDEHPNVVVALKIGGAVIGAAAIGYTGYKIGSKSCTEKKIQDSLKGVSDDLSKLIIENCEKSVSYGVSKNSFAIDNEHTFDMTFTDVMTGDKYTIKDSCMGSYVNDMIDDFANYPNIAIVAEAAAKEV